MGENPDAPMQDMILDGSLHFTDHPELPLNTPAERKASMNKLAELTNADGGRLQMGKMGAHVGVTPASLAAGVAERAFRDVVTFFSTAVAAKQATASL